MDVGAGRQGRQLVLTQLRTISPTIRDVNAERVIVQFGKSKSHQLSVQGFNEQQKRLQNERGRAEC
jgi:UDP-N-acetylglucosamine transferase subunit ALG13